jgi:hypothetical protein
MSSFNPLQFGHYLNVPNNIIELRKKLAGFHGLEFDLDDSLFIQLMPFV